MSSKLTIYPILTFIAFIFTVNITNAQEVKIPETYLNLKHLQVMDAYEGYEASLQNEPLDYYRNLTEKSQYHINIPTTSIDTSGLIDVSDTINNYISRAFNLSGDTIMVTILLPPGTLLIEKTINVLSGVYVKGDGAVRTLIKCKVGEGKHCFELKPTKVNAVAAIPIAIQVKKGDQYIYLDSSRTNAALSNLKQPYLAALVKKDDSSLITSSWAKGSVKEHFWLRTNAYSGNNYKIGSSIGNDIKVGGKYGFIEIDRNKDWWPHLYAYTGITQNVKYVLLDYDTSLVKTQVEIYESIKYAGILCLGIERLDTTVSQTSNIKLTNATHCLIKAVESKNCNFAHIELNNSFLNVIKRCHIYDGNGYGGGGKAYGVLLQEGSSSNTVLDNLLHHLRHSILLQSGANNNIIIANYSFDPYWEGTSLPADAAGDIVLHGNYPFGNLFEFNVAQQIVIDDSHGKNGPYNIFHRNWLKGYGIFMSATNGSDSQVFTGNEITNSGFLKGQYILQDIGHFEYGNQVIGSLLPNGTNKSHTKSVSHLNYGGFFTRRLVLPSPPNIVNSSNVPFGEPFNQKDKSIDALIRDAIAPLCYYKFTDSYLLASINKLENSKNFIYPNPSNGRLKVSESGELSIYDLQGRLVYMRTIVSPSEIEIIGLKGLFIAKLKTETTVFSQKILFD